MENLAYPEIEINDAIERLKLQPFHKIGLAATILSTRPLLHYLPIGIPSYTDHGVLHSQNLMKLLCGFLDNWKGTAFTSEEKYLLSAAVWLHDIGCLLGREKHNEKSVELLKHPCFSFLDNFMNGDLKECLKNIIISHSSKYDINKIPETPINRNVRLDLCCVTFRLLDGCDITDARTKPILFEILSSCNLIDPDSKDFWESHLSTIGSVFNGNEINVTYRVGKQKQAEVLVNHLKADLEVLNKIFGKYGMRFEIILRPSEF